jgi:hypothetical protein
MRKLFPIMMVVCFLGCQTDRQLARAERDLSDALKFSFELENFVPPERSLLKLNGHAFNLELMLRASHLDNSRVKIRPLLRRFFAAHSFDEGLIKSRLENIVSDVGCSKALLILLMEERCGIPFEFFENSDLSLNPRFRYSKALLEERKVFSKRSPLAPRGVLRTGLRGGPRAEQTIHSNKRDEEIDECGLVVDHDCVGNWYVRI